MFNGSGLREVRKKLRLSQEELGELINADSNLISRWERSAATPSADYIAALSDVLGVSTDFLIKGTDGNAQNAADAARMAVLGGAGALIGMSGVALAAGVLSAILPSGARIELPDTPDMREFFTRLVMPERTPKRDDKK